MRQELITQPEFPELSCSRSFPSTSFKETSSVKENRESVGIFRNSCLFFDMEASK